MSKPYDQGAPPAYPQPAHQDAGPAPGGMQPSYYNQGGGAPDYYGGSPNPYQQGAPQGQYGPPQGQYGPPQGQYGYGGQQMQYQQGPPPPGGYYQDDRRADGGGGGLFAGLCAGFLTTYRAACQQLGTSLVDVSPDWAPYDQLPPPQSTVTVSFQPLTSTQTSALTQATSALSSSLLSGIITQHSTKTTANASSSAMPTPTGPADGQIPICGISEKCMTKKPQGEPSCSTGDLDCICKASNSLEKNTEFDQQCVLDACYGDIGKEEFLESLVYHCKKVNKQLTGIPQRWEPYLPATFPTATPDAAPPVNSKGPVPVPAAPAHAPFRLSGGAIAGIVTAAILVLVLVLGLLKLWWDSRKKANTLKKDNAKLQDATNPEGMSMRINTLISDSSIPEFASRRDTTSAGRGADPSTYGASAYNDATLIGSPRSTNGYLSPGNSATPHGHKYYGAKTEDYNMSEYGDDQYTGHGRQYSRDPSRHELPDNEYQGGQAAPRQGYSDDDSVSRYSHRRNSYDDETVDLQQQRGQEATSEWGMAQSGEGTRKQEEDQIRRSARH
ncbi:hypothetical protein G6011_03575 [Alternaria panax]|uniref:Extracellular membrane protein CFEM domain-containing protein n=1 Tax=Alternaria panax TaxID=48097 RepID=A0AAD4NU60_9PLEO|nr:hypothetical protein G6011_03575 [Alternaria panax]